MMEEAISDIVARGREPVYEIDAFYGRLNAAEQAEFWEVIQRLIEEGNKKERFCALTAVSFREELLSRVVDGAVRHPAGDRPRASGEK